MCQTLKVFLIILLFSESVLSRCTVTENNSLQKKPCVFPFKLPQEDGKNEVHNICTDSFDPDGRFWCSTKTDRDGIHQKGHWGYCDKGEGECPMSEIDQLLQTVKSKASQNCPCTSLQECEWANNLLSLLKDLTSTNPNRVKAITFIRRQVCNAASKKIKCCSLTKNSTPTPRPPILSPRSQEEIKPNGTWIPQDSKGECGKRLTTEQIIGGEIAKLAEFPYMALLGYVVERKRYYLCGGAVINTKYILTAAHCHSTERPLRQVIVGEHTLAEDPDCVNGGNFCLPKPQTFRIDKVTQHQNWEFKLFQEGYDIALVRIRGEIKLFGVGDDGMDSFVSPVCLPWNSNDPGHDVTTGDKTTVTGWGRMTNNATVSSENYKQFNAASRTLQKVELPIVEMDVCSEFYESFDYTFQMCAGSEKGKDSCGGDSGGPMVVRKPSGSWYQAGIVSFGPKRCGIGRPGVYTKVSKYLDWIRNSLEP